METANFRKFLQSYLALFSLICLWYLNDNHNLNSRWFAFAGILLLAALILLVLVTRSQPKDESHSRRNFPISVLIGLNVLLGIVFILALTHVPLSINNFLSGRLIFVMLFAGLAALALHYVDSKREIFLDFSWNLLLLGFWARVAAFIPEAQPGPFALGWSEGSRLYNASLFDAVALYGQKLPLPVLHPSRYLMQAVPYFLGVQSILAHRIWQIALWLVMTGLGAWLLARRVAGGIKIPVFWVSLFFSLFFFQGAVYYHLMLVVILVLLGYSRDKPWRTLLFVLVASVWAGISRVNWWPVPALLAASLYLLDSPFEQGKVFQYLRWPFLWAISGGMLALATNRTYIALSGNDPTLFNSAFTSGLLWERLFPNATFFLGILPAILLVCLPLTYLVIRQKVFQQIHWLRRLGLLIILAVFFLGGLVVSVKIGGGGDLHNMDGFLVLFALITASLLAGAFEADRNLEGAKFSYQPHPVWLMLLVMIPVAFAFMQSNYWNFSNTAGQEKALTQLNASLDLLKNQPGEVLFISERQLLSFHQVPGVSIVPDYEKVFLMEMAMGNNEAYLQGFYDALQSHRFKAIISDPISTTYQDRSRSFAEENNAWVTHVVIPMLKDYQPAASWENGEINLLIPIGQEVLLGQIQQLQQ